jgi:hypothetical protein
MTDQELSDLFAVGTAPDPDPVFTRSVTARIGRARRLGRLAPLALPATAALAASAGLFAAARLARPALAPLVEASPQLMGVPAPLVLVAAAAGLVLAGRRVLARSRSADDALPSF